MVTTLTAKERKLVDVFDDDYLFSIPLYQRPYAWTTEEVDELLDDLQNALSRDPKAPYFMGSIVLVKDDASPASEVVDGQQRLTTLTILLCVLRDLALDRPIADEIDHFVRQAGLALKRTKDHYRVNLRERDRIFFANNVQRKGATSDLLHADGAAFTDSQKRLFENVQYLYRVLSEVPHPARDELVYFVVQQCYLVVVAASDRDSAYRIFSVMNDRGLDLSPTDILKAEVLGKMPAASQEAYAAKWEDIEEALGRHDFRTLFNHIRMIYRRDKQRGTLQEEVRESVLVRLSEQAFVDDVLEPYSRVYEVVSRASYVSMQDAERVNSLLRHLHRLDNVDWVPPAMAWLHRHPQNSSLLIRFMRDLERLAYVLFIRRANINERIKRYAQVIEYIDRNSDLFQPQAPLQLTAEEKTEVHMKLNGDIYNQPRIKTPLLLRLDGLLADGVVTYQRAVITVEHVLPQRPMAGSQWAEWFPDDEEREQWTHRLANLVLLSRRKNASASNYDFEKKKQEYFQKGGTTTFALTAQTLTETSWTPRVLHRRQKALLRTLAAEWRLN